MTDPWGAATPPAPESAVPGPLPARLAMLAGLTEETVLEEFRFPEPDDLPEVRVLHAKGWVALSDAPLYHTLPAAWRPHDRIWIPDRRPSVAITGGMDPGPWHIVPRGAWWQDDRADLDPFGEQADLDAFADEVGLPPRPRRRIYLLRSPRPSISFENLLMVIADEASAAGDPHPHHNSNYPFYFAAQRIMQWSEAQVLERLHRITASI